MSKIDKVHRQSNEPAAAERTSADTQAPGMMAAANSALGSQVIHRKLARRRAQRQVDGNGVAEGAEAEVQRASGGSGSALPQTLQRKFEGSLGADLSGVRVHTGAASAAAAESVGARAYASGSDIHLGAAPL